VPILVIATLNTSLAMEINRYIKELSNKYSYIVTYVWEYLPQHSLEIQYFHKPLAKLEKDFEQIVKLKELIVFVNTICIDSVRQQLMNYIDSKVDNVVLIDYCLNHVSCYKNLLSLPPYITIVKTFIDRITTIFSNIDEILIRIKICRECLKTLSILHNIDTIKTIDLFQELIKQVIKNNYGIEISINTITEFLLTARGIVKGYREKRTYMYRVEISEEHTNKSYMLQLLAILLLITDGYNKAMRNICISDIGLDEGLYSIFFAYLVKHGANISVNIL